MSMEDILRSLAQDWLGPAGITVIFTCIAGGIIWGVQINAALVAIKESLGRLTKSEEHHETDIRSNSDNILTATLLLKQLEDAQKQLADDFQEHVREAEGWKAKIEVLDERTKNSQ